MKHARDNIKYFPNHVRLEYRPLSSNLSYLRARAGETSLRFSRQRPSKSSKGFILSERFYLFMVGVFYCSLWGTTGRLLLYSHRCRITLVTNISLVTPSSLFRLNTASTPRHNTTSLRLRWWTKLILTTKRNNGCWPLLGVAKSQKRILIDHQLPNVPFIRRRNYTKVASRTTRRQVHSTILPHYNAVRNIHQLPFQNFLTRPNK